MLPLFQAACRLGIKSFISGLIAAINFHTFQRKVFFYDVIDHQRKILKLIVTRVHMIHWGPVNMR